MRRLITMPANLVALILQGEKDELTDEMDRRLRSIKSAPCPRCGAALQPRVYASAPFSPNDPLPRMTAVCECGFEQHPESGLVLSPGSATKVDHDPLPIIKPKD